MVLVKWISTVPAVWAKLHHYLSKDGDTRACSGLGEMRVGMGLPSSWNGYLPPLCFGVARKAVVALVGAQLPAELTQEPPVISPLSLMSPA
jgi:hypothetical protein